MSTLHRELTFCPAGHSGHTSYDDRRLDYINIKNGTCNMCTKEQFIKDSGTWTSGNADIDKIILDSQIKDFYYNLQWIPYDNLHDIEHVADNEHYTMCFAELKDCLKYGWDFVKQHWLIDNGGSVALKELKGHIYDILEFIKGIKNIINSSMCITEFKGISKNPSTQNYIIIIEWNYPFTICSFLVNIFLEVEWEIKIKLLHHIIEGLNLLHENNLIHGELHSQNILMSSGEPYLNLMYRCWNGDPSKRPKVHELINLLQDFDYLDADDNIEIMNRSHTKKLLRSLSKVHPQSCYIDRRIFTLDELQDSLEDIKFGKCADPNLLNSNKPIV
ncbi:6223_t:CDS:2 [Diversispora eburnea]|uniref:6223_t:CDS:1 n=1 Tax=Diversispora eburnea TaxID=1213867 RepID=A0A9N8UZE7_9GLOM|nr:6223_t:CDS:2 [Diversispora eburnea]